MNLPKVKILCTSVGNDGFPTVYKSLKCKQVDYDFEIIGTDIRDNAAGIYIADKSYIVSPRDNKNHLHEIENIIQENQVDFLLPLSTIDQTFYSLNRNYFDIPIITSSYKANSISNNKYYLLTYFSKSNSQKYIPKFFKVKSIDDLLKKSKTLGYPDSKIVFKMDFSTGGRGLKILDNSIRNKERLINIYNKECTLEELIVILENIKKFPDSHLVEYLPGDEYSVDVLCETGITKSAVVRKRYSSVGGLALDAEVVKELDVEQAAKNIVKEIGLSYVINVQFRRDINNHPKLMEINPRIPGTIGLTIEAGVNMPYMAILMALHKDFKINKPEIGKRIIRIWDGVYFNQKK